MSETPKAFQLETPVNKDEAQKITFVEATAPSAESLASVQALAGTKVKHEGVIYTLLFSRSGGSDQLYLMFHSNIGKSFDASISANQVYTPQSFAEALSSELVEK